MLEIKITDPQRLTQDAIDKLASFLKSVSYSHDAEDVIPKSSICECPCEDNPANYAVAPQEFADPVMSSVVKQNATIAVELDANGLPWDGRIHSREKTKMKNGAWKPRRNVNKEDAAKIETQLQNTMTAPIVTTTPVPPPMPAALVVPPPPAPIPTITSAMSFAEIMLKVTTLVQENKITSARVLELLRSLGVEGMPLLPARPDLIPALSSLIDAEILGK